MIPLTTGRSLDRRKFLATATFAAACLSPALLTMVSNTRAKQVVLAGCLGALVALEAPHAMPERLLDRPEDFTSPENVRVLTIEDINQHDFTHYYSSYLPIEVHRLPRLIPSSKLEPARGVTVLAEEIRSDRYEFEISAEQPTQLVVNTFWFPGWQATIDRQRQPIEPEPETGRLMIGVQPGHHLLTVFLGETPVRQWSQLLSSAALVLFGFAWVWPRVSDKTSQRIMQ